MEQARHIGDIEQELRRLLQMVGRTSLEKLLQQAGHSQAKETACECGGELHYRQQRAATVITVFGRVKYEHAYYSGCGCGKGRASLDERLHLQAGAVTPGLANLLALGGIQLSHERSRAWLQEFLLFDPSENTIWKETKRMGKPQEPLEQEWVAQSQDAAWLQARQQQEAACARDTVLRH